MPDFSNEVLCGIDAGGTTFKCGIFSTKEKLLQEQRFPVTSPTETIDKCVNFFRGYRDQIGASIVGLGVASFGPVDVDLSSSTYGSILTTPKAGWSNTPVKTMLEEALEVEVAFDTDVNGALLAERKKGAAKNAKSAVYVTIGTGIGAGVWVNDGFAGRPSHPEFGHISVQRHPDDIAYQSNCPFHDDCLEGLASASALTRRFGDTKMMTASHAGWAVEAFYLAQACRSLYLTLRPDKIVLGGGLMLAPFLIDMVRETFVKQMAGYTGVDIEFAERAIVTPELGDHAGLFGAMLLGKTAP